MIAYEAVMNFAKPILICDENEGFRDLIREMLTKNGFFHIVEASNSEETLKHLQDKKEYFVIIHSSLLNNELSKLMGSHKDFLVLANNMQESTVMLAATLGVDHILSFPIHSKKLMEKMESLL